MTKLIAQDGTEYRITSPVTTIGREDCDIVLPDDDLISRRHAKIEQQGDELTLVDMNSTNGTFVNGVPVQGAYDLQPGDQVQIGNSTLAVSIGGGGDNRTRVMTEPPSRSAPTRAAGHTPPAHGSPQSYAKPAKDRSIALILELLPGLLGFLGIGWIYAGQTTTGVIVLAIGVLCNVTFWVIALVTVGFSLCITVPIQLAAVGVSSYLLHQYAQKRTDLFGA